MLFKIEQKSENRIQIEKSYGSKRECAVKYSTQKTMQRNLDLGKLLMGGKVLMLDNLSNFLVHILCSLFIYYYLLVPNQTSSTFYLL